MNRVDLKNTNAAHPHSQGLTFVQLLLEPLHLKPSGDSKFTDFFAPNAVNTKACQPQIQTQHLQV